MVLIVDDDVDLAAVLTELLETRGLSACVATSGAEALRLLRRHTPLVCILDWYLPDGEPISVAAECRMRHIPIVLSSAAGEPEVLATKIGAAGVLQKPFDIERFFRIVSEVSGSSLVT